jgi:hypothetical protein
VEANGVPLLRSGIHSVECENVASLGSLRFALAMAAAWCNLIKVKLNRLKAGRLRSIHVGLACAVVLPATAAFLTSSV